MRTREEIQEFVHDKLVQEGAKLDAVGRYLGDLAYTKGVNVAGLMGDQIRQGLNLYGGRARMGGPFTAAGTKERRKLGKQNVDRAIVDPVIGTKEKPGALQVGIAQLLDKSKLLDKYDEVRLGGVQKKIKKYKGMLGASSERSEKENEKLRSELQRLQAKEATFKGRLGIGESYSYGPDNTGRSRGERFLRRYGAARQLNPEFSEIPLTTQQKRELEIKRRQEAETQAQRQGEIESETMRAAGSIGDVADAVAALKKSGESIKTKVKGALKSKLNPYDLEP